MNVLEIDRIVLAIEDIETTINRFESLLDLSFGEIQQSTADEHVKISYGQLGIELMAPLTDETPIADYLETNGPGIWGVVLRVEDLDAAVSELAEQDIEPINKIDHQEAPEVFFHPTDFEGVMTILTEYSHPINR